MIDKDFSLEQTIGRLQDAMTSSSMSKNVSRHKTLEIHQTNMVTDKKPVTYAREY